MMRLLRNIFYIGMMMSVLSCKKLQEVTDVSETTSPIEITPSLLTKAYITSADDPNFRAGLSIFAIKTPRGQISPQSKTIMDNTKLSFDSQSGLWVYSPAVFWSLNCDHHFLGIFPYKGEGEQNGEYINENETFILPSVSTITNVNTSNEGTNLGDDIMYGRDHVYFQIGEPIRKVQLQMTHALSAISVHIRNAAETSSVPNANDIVSISNIKLSHFITDVTNLKISKNQDLAPTWTESPIRKTYVFPNFTETIPQGDIHPKRIFPPAIIIPQDFTKNSPEDHLELIFDVTFQDGTVRKDVTIDLNKIELPNQNPADKLKYLPGFHYKYNVEITSVNINCRVEIKPWIEDPPIDLEQ